MAVVALAVPGLLTRAFGQGVTRHALLVGCTKYDNLDERSHLTGPANDVVLFRRLLEDHYKLEPKAIVTLSEGQGGADSRPTYKNIAREFAALADRNKVKPGDQVIILMGGHGFYVPNDNPGEEDPEPDGYDEVFLPADCGLWNSGARTIPNCIRDDELGKWLGDIRRTGAFVWFIADSCHSGTIQRGAFGEVSRELQMSTLGIESDDPQFRPAGQQRGASGGSEIADGAPQGGSGKLVAIYAALSSQPTVELPLPYEADEKQRKPYGLLTFTICQVLTRASSNLSYGELIERIGQQYRAWNRGGNPTPQAEGDGMTEGVLAVSRGGQLPGSPSATRSATGYYLDNGPGNTFMVKAGTLHGLSPNCILAVRPRAGEGDDVLGYVSVQDCTALDCVVKPCEYKGQTAVDKTKLPIGGRVDLAWVNFAGLKPLRIAVEVAGQRAPTAPKVDAGELTAGIPKGMVELISEPRNAHWVVRVQDGIATLLPADQWATMAAGNSLPPGADKRIADFGPVLLDAAGERKLSTTIRRIAQSRNLLSVTEAEGGSPFGQSGVNVKLEFRRHEGRADTEGKPLETTSGRPIPFVEPGEMVGVRVTNIGADDVYVTLLYIDSNYKISKWYPRMGNLPDRLSAKASLGAPAIARATVTDDTWGLEHFVAIAVKAEGQPQDYGWLAEETIEGARGATRGNSSPLSRLFQYAAYREGAARGAAAEEGAVSCVRSMAWNVAPPQPK